MIVLPAKRPLLGYVLAVFSLLFLIFAIVSTVLAVDYDVTAETSPEAGTLLFIPNARANAVPATDRGFVTGPDTPPAGVGSYNAQITVADQGLAIGVPGFIGAELGELVELSYCTYNASPPPPPNNATWYVNIYVDANNDGAQDTRLDFAIDNNGGAALNTWECWSLESDTVLFADPNGPTPGSLITLANFLTANPNTVLDNAFDAAGLPSIAFNLGDSASNYVGFNSFIDNIAIEFDGFERDTWDFEPIIPTATPSPTLPPDDDDDNDDDDDDEDPTSTPIPATATLLPPAPPLSTPAGLPGLEGGLPPTPALPETLPATGGQPPAPAWPWLLGLGLIFGAGAGVVLLGRRSVKSQ